MPKAKGKGSVGSAAKKPKSEDSSNSSKARECNTGLVTSKGSSVQSSGAKNWTYRWSNYSSNWSVLLTADFTAAAALGWIAGQEICPTTGTPHIQGYVHFEHKVRWSAFKSLPKGIEWQAAKGTKHANEKYCSKEGNAIARGDCNVYEKYTLDLYLRKWQEDIMTEIVDQAPDDRVIYNFWEPEGGTGKTTFQKWLFMHRNGVVVLSGKASDMKHGIVCYKEAQGCVPKIVVINIPRCQDIDHISWQGIEEIKDMFFFSPKYEGGMVCDRSPTMMIFSNEPIPDDKLSKDRYCVIRLPDKPEPATGVDGRE